MPMGIEEFRSAINNFSRPTLFKVTIPAVLGVATEFLVKAASIPESTLGIIEVPYLGRKIKIPGDRTYNDWQITVMDDQQHVLRKAFEEWSNSINGFESNVGPFNYQDNLHDAFVRQLAQDGVPTGIYKIVGTFPSEVGAIDLSWESNDSIAEYTVTLTYQYWVRVL